MKLSKEKNSLLKFPTDKGEERVRTAIETNNIYEGCRDGELGRTLVTVCRRFVDLFQSSSQNPVPAFVSSLGCVPSSGTLVGVLVPRERSTRLVNVYSGFWDLPGRGVDG